MACSKQLLLFKKMHLKEFWRLKYLIFPCHSSCTVVSSDIPLLGGNVQLTAVRAAAERVPGEFLPRIED